MTVERAMQIAASCPTIAVCWCCGDLALLPTAAGRCFWCGGWIGREDLPMKDVGVITDRLLGRLGSLN